MPSGVTHILFFVHLGIILILVLGFYSGLCSRFRTEYRFSLCVVPLLSSRFAASALVWFSNFLKYLVFNCFISLSTVFIYRSSWILWLFMNQGAFRMDRRFLDQTMLLEAKFYDILRPVRTPGPPTCHFPPFRFSV
jgi:hypothetical protein